MYQTQSLPIDWTNGAGVFPGGGSIAIPASNDRKWVKVQNQDVTSVSIQFAGVKSSDGTACTVTLVLGPAATAGGQGADDERTLTDYVPVGAITVTGTAGNRVMVVTGGA